MTKYLAFQKHYHHLLIVPQTKSDRISVLRKQYDSFLEEDKRRKERNEYILGQLDKMRDNSSSALVLRHQVPTRLPKVPPPVLYDYENPVNMKHAEYKPHLIKNPQVPALMSILPPTSLGKELLREISMKYIMIPKVDQRVAHEFPEEMNTLDNENDWKSKYDILDQLKKNEKELVREGSLKITKPDNIESKTTQNAEKDSAKPGHGLNLNMIHNEIPEKDTSVNRKRDDVENHEKVTETQYVELNQNHPDKNFEVDGGVAVIIADNIKDDTLYSNYPPKPDKTYGTDSANNYAPQYQEIQYQESSPDTNPVYKHNQEPLATETQYITRKDRNPQDDNNYHLDQSNLDKKNQQNEFEDKGQTEIPEKYYYNEENYATNPENNTEEIGINKEDTVVYQDNTNVEATECPTEIQSSEESITASNIIVKHGVKVDSGVAVEEKVAFNDVNNTQNEAGTQQVPYDENYEQNTESTVVAEYENHADDAAAIEEFEQENSQMFTTESVDKTLDSTAHNLEYTGEQAEYDPNAYQYYEEQQQIEYTENAADLQAYDQNYEQQYGQQGYENQELSYEQQRQSYDQQQGYEQQPQAQQAEQGYDPPQAYEQVFQQPGVEDQQQVPPEVYDQQLYYENNTPGMLEIQQQLDQEQSFVEPTPPPSEQPKPDPKYIIVAD